MTEYTRPCVYRTGFSIDVFDGNGSIKCIWCDDPHNRIVGRSFIDESQDLEFLEAILDGISVVHYQLREFRKYVTDRAVKIEIDIREASLHE